MSIWHHANYHILYRQHHQQQNGLNAPLCAHGPNRWNFNLNLNIPNLLIMIMLMIILTGMISPSPCP